MNREILIAWLHERRENCKRIAETKTGDERAGWIEDASFFDWAMECCERIPQEIDFDIFRNMEQSPYSPWTQDDYIDVGWNDCLDHLKANGYRIVK